MLEVLFATFFAITAILGSFTVVTQCLHLQQSMQRTKPLSPCVTEPYFSRCGDQVIIFNQI